MEEVDLAEVTVQHDAEPNLTRCLIVRETYVDTSMSQAYETAARFGYVKETRARRRGLRRPRSVSVLLESCSRPPSRMHYPPHVSTSNAVEPRRRLSDQCPGLGSTRD